MPVTPSTDHSYVCHGITWANGIPSLLLAGPPEEPLTHHEIMHRRLGFQVNGTGRWCTGRYRFVDTVRVEPLACADQAPAVRGGQCDRCSGSDDFRFAHQFHRGGHAPKALVAYMAQPHWLYTATFADGTTKVGTAAGPRRKSRLDEQGALFATYLARCEDGREVRLLEDAVSRRLGLSQSMRAAAKIQALAGSWDASTVLAEHERQVARAVEALAGMGVSGELTAWVPPGDGEILRQAGTARAFYPHDVRRGEHGITPISCIGSHVLAELDSDNMAYLLDLGALKGSRITIGQFSSASVAVQTGLF